VHHRTVSGAPEESDSELASFGNPLRYNSPDMSGAHRTVRCTSGATAIFAQRSTLQSEQYCGRSQSSGQRGTGLSGGAPDCPVPHEDRASNGRPASSPNGRMTRRRTGHYPVAHRTLSGGSPDCPVRPSPAHFTND
jgi:hypothetical protein